MKRVIIESPFAGATDEEMLDNIAYAQACLRDSLLRGEAPFASHLLYTQPGVLDDKDPDERRHGIESGFAFRECCELTVVYVDRGISKGMEWGISHAEEIGCPVVYRRLQ